jgi:hypothetical protein
MENPLGKNEKSARLKWKVRSRKLLKSALLKENMRSVKLKIPLSKNIYSAGLKWKIRSVKMESALSKSEKFAR